jgi:soluble lytic murein transglycosylase-like protein
MASLFDLVRNLTAPKLMDPAPTMPTPTPDPFIAKGLYKTGPNSYSTTPPSATPSQIAPPPTVNAPAGSLPGYANGNIPGDTLTTITSTAKRYGLNPAVLAAVLMQESGFNAKAVNGQDRGMAQINAAAHPEVTDQQAYDPRFAVDFAGHLLSGNLQKFGDINRAVAAYNVGPGGASVRGNNPYGGGPKGQSYINAVSRNLSPDVIKSMGLKVGPVVPVQ